MADLFVRAVLWVRGWRYDLDGFLVRARQHGDVHDLSVELGFVEESAIAVRTVDDAWLVDAWRRGWTP